MAASNVTTKKHAKHAILKITGRTSLKKTNASATLLTTNQARPVNHAHQSSTANNAQLLTNAQHATKLATSSPSQSMTSAFAFQAGTSIRIKSAKIAPNHKRDANNVNQLPNAQFVIPTTTGYLMEVENVSVKMDSGKMTPIVHPALQKLHVALNASKTVHAKRAKLHVL